MTKPTSGGADRKQREASAQLQRVLALIPVIADGEEHAVAEVAASLGVDASTVLRDLESFADRFDAPGGFVEGLQIYIDGARVSARTNHFLRPMRLTRGELYALDFGLALSRTERPPSEWRAIDGARERLQRAAAALPKESDSENPYVVGESAAVSAQLGAMREAISRKNKARIVYRRGESAQSDERIIEPYRLLLFGPTWYVAAHCEQSADVRIFRMDRVESAEVLAEKSAAEHFARVEERLGQGGPFAAEASARLRVRFGPKAARWVREHESGVEGEDGAYVVEYPLADLEWAVRHVLQYGTEAEVLDPPEARAHVARRLREMLASRVNDLRPSDS
jgi:proteasome accessory factor C